MTRARILKPAQQPPAPAAPLHGALPWLADATPPRRRAQVRTLPKLPQLPTFPALPLPRIDWRAALGRAAARLQAARAPGVILAPAPVAARAGTPHNAGRAPMGLGKRVAVLLAIITVPAMAAPGEFAMFAEPDAAAPAPDPLALAAANALAFERPGMSFPGSAFFYLADPPAEALIALPAANPLESGAEAGRELGEFIKTGPAAKPFFSSGSGISHARAQECLAQAIWYEAASESEAGQRAVAQVVLNRVAHPAWPASVCGVVYQGAERQTGCQFTFTCDGSLGRRASGATWARAQAIAARALAGDVYAPVGHATHYHTLWVNPYWARTLDHVGTIGAHRFYRNRGPGGEKAAFRMAYAGYEPGVRGRTSAPATMPGDGTAGNPAGFAAPSGAARGGKAGLNGSRSTRQSARSAQASTAPAGKAEFTSAGTVKPEFANAGQWKGEPALRQARQAAETGPAASTSAASTE